MNERVSLFAYRVYKDQTVDQVGTLPTQGFYGETELVAPGSLRENVLIGQIRQSRIKSIVDFPDV